MCVELHRDGRASRLFAVVGLAVSIAVSRGKCDESKQAFNGDYPRASTQHDADDDGEVAGDGGCDVCSVGGGAECSAGVTSGVDVVLKIIKFSCLQ